MQAPKKQKMAALVFALVAGTAFAVLASRLSGPSRLTDAEMADLQGGEEACASNCLPSAPNDPGFAYRFPPYYCGRQQPMPCSDDGPCQRWICGDGTERHDCMDDGPTWWGEIDCSYVAPYECSHGTLVHETTCQQPITAGSRCIRVPSEYPCTGNVTACKN
jgi:hypothetical protein